MRRCCVRVMRLGRRQAARSRTEFLDSQRAHAAADAREYAPETAALRTAADSPTHPFGDDRQSLLPDPAYEAYTSDAGIDGNSNFEVNTIWCAMGTPAPDACLSHEIVSGDYTSTSTFGFGTMDRVAGPDGDPESIYNQF